MRTITFSNEKLPPYQMIRKTIYNDNLRSPDSYTVRCGDKKLNVSVGDEKKIADFFLNVWDEDPSRPAGYVYYNIDWDCDDVIFCKYDLIGDEFFPAESLLSM